MASLSSVIIPNKSLQIFDLGNVLYKVDARLTMAALEKLGMPHLDGPVSNSHAAGGVFGPYCDGLVSTADFIKGVREMCHLNPDTTDSQIVDAWNAMLIGFDRSSIEAVRAVRSQGHKVALLSNCNELHADWCRKEFTRLFPDFGSFDSQFDKVFFSQEIKMSKPNPETWQLVLSSMGVSASDAVFYDDSPINTAQAEALGIQSVVFCL